MPNHSDPAPTDPGALRATLLAIAPSTPVVDRLLSMQTPKTRIGAMNALPSQSGRTRLAGSALGAVAMARSAALDVGLAARLAIDTRVTVREALWSNPAIVDLVEQRPELLRHAEGKHLSVDALTRMVPNASDLVALDQVANDVQFPDRPGRTRYLRALRRAVVARGEGAEMLRLVAAASADVVRALTPTHEVLGVSVRDVMCQIGGIADPRSGAVVAGWFDLIGTGPVPDELVTLLHDVATKAPRGSVDTLKVPGRRRLTSEQVSDLVQFPVGASLVIASVAVSAVSNHQLRTLLDTASISMPLRQQLVACEDLVARLTDEQADRLARSLRNEFLSVDDTRHALRARAWSAQAMADLHTSWEMDEELFADAFELNPLTWACVQARHRSRSDALAWCDRTLPADREIGPGAARVWDQIGTWTLAQASRPDHDHLLAWVRGLAESYLGQDPDAWMTAMRLAEKWTGSLSELFATTAAVNA